jgi:hypothetical protein
MSRRALRLTVDLPDLSIPLTEGAVLRESESEPGVLTIAVRLDGPLADAMRRRFAAAGALPVILPDAEEAA